MFITLHAKQKNKKKPKNNLQPNELLLITNFARFFYYRREENDDLICQIYGVISDTKRHTYFEIKVFNDCLLENFKKSFDIKVKNTIIWSDRDAAHFKNLYSIAPMSPSDIFSEWNFVSSIMEKDQVSQLVNS